MSAEPQKQPTKRSAVLSQRPEYQRLGEWIRRERESRGLKQRPLSVKLGKPEQFLHKVETGRQRIDFVEFADLCREFGTSADDLVALLRSLRDQ